MPLRAQRLLRSREGAPGAERDRARNSELFFDLVYVFAITQLSHHLLDDRTWDGALQTLILFGGVWLGWMYTTWVTNWLDPDVLPTRLMLFAVMLLSLVLAAGLPRAFASEGRVVAVAFAVMHVGRSAYTALALDGHPRLQRNFQRILAWCALSGGLWVAGSFVAGHVREAVWAGAIAADLLGAAAGFWTPGLGRSTTADWKISGSHMAERCQAFVLIALGESIVETGTALSGFDHFDAGRIGGMVVAFIGAAAVWLDLLRPQRRGGHGSPAVLGRPRPARPQRLPLRASGDGGGGSWSSPRATRRCSPTPAVRVRRRPRGWCSADQLCS